MKNPYLLLIPVLALPVLLYSCAQHNLPAGSNELNNSAPGNSLYGNRQANKGEMVEFDVAGGPAGQAYEVRAAEPGKKYLLVFHDRWGLNVQTKREADQWHGRLDNVHVLAIDLLDGKVTSNSDQAEEYADNLEDERAEAIIQGVLEYLSYDARVATLGWGLGGTWSMEAAIIAGANAIGCVLMYGEPVDDDQVLKQLNTDVLAIFGEEDKSLQSAIVEDFKGEMEDAGEEVTVVFYSAGHAFADPTSEHYDPEAARKANKKALEYLEKKFEETY